MVIGTFDRFWSNGIFWSSLLIDFFYSSKNSELETLRRFGFSANDKRPFKSI